jgi:hypothetical protein
MINPADPGDAGSLGWAWVNLLVFPIWPDDSCEQSIRVHSDRLSEVHTGRLEINW